MEPIAKLLKSKANSEDWNPALRGALRSAIAGRQYPQARVYAAGWADHNKCLFCLHKLAGLGSQRSRRVRLRCKTSSNTAAPAPPSVHPDGWSQDAEVGDATRQSKIQHKVEATTEQVAAAPVGNLGHRIWRCQADWMSKLRSKWATPADCAVTLQCNTDGHPLWERALQPRPSKPMRATAKEETFRWVIEPPQRYD